MSSWAAAEARRKLFTYFCWLYITLGLVCLGAGSYLAFIALAHSGRTRPDPLFLLIAAILIVFGLIRIGVAVWRLRIVNSRIR